MVGLEGVLKRLGEDLAQLRASWALMGGLAVSARTEPRTTRDVDVAIAVVDDQEAQSLVRELSVRGYSLETVVEQEATDRLATVRLLAPGESSGGIIVDLLFASSGVEAEIAFGAEPLELLPGIEIPVATTGQLLAVKILAGRRKDLMDIEALRQEARLSDLEECASLLRLIQERGYHRNQDLLSRWSELQSEGD